MRITVFALMALIVVPCFGSVKLNSAATAYDARVVSIGGGEFLTLFSNNPGFWQLSRADIRGSLVFGPVPATYDPQLYPLSPYDGIAWSGAALGWAYEANPNGGPVSSIYFHTIDRNGVMLTAPIEVSPSAAGNNPYGADLIWSGGSFIVGYASGYGGSSQLVWCRILAPTGVPVSPEILVEQVPSGEAVSPPDVTRRGDHVLVAWERNMGAMGGALKVAILDPIGNVEVAPRVIEPAVPGKSVGLSDAAVVPEQYDRFALLYTYSDGSGFSSPVYQSHVDVFGNVVLGPQLIGMANYPNAGGRPVAVDQGFGIVGASGVIILRDVSSERAVASFPLVVSDSPSGVTAPRIAYQDRVFGITWTDYREPTGPDVFFDVAPGYETYAVGTGPSPSAGPEVRLHQPEFLTRQVITTIIPYGAGGYGANVSSAEIDGSGEDEVLTGPGPGPSYGPQVRAFEWDGMPKGKVSFYAYGTLKYGVRVAATKLDADAYQEMLTVPGPGVVFGPHVRGFDFDNAVVQAMPKVSFYAYGTLKYGANVAGARVDADPYGEIVTGPGPGASFGSQLRGFDYDGAAVASIPAINVFAFTASTHGLHVAGGDADWDGFEELACAAGPGPANDSRIVVYDYDGAALQETAGSRFEAFPGSLGGAVVSFCQHHDKDLARELLVSRGPVPSSTSEVVVRDDAAAAFAPVASFDPYPGGTHGSTLGSVFMGF